MFLWKHCFTKGDEVISNWTDELIVFAGQLVGAFDHLILKSKGKSPFIIKFPYWLVGIY